MKGESVANSHSRHSELVFLRTKKVSLFSHPSAARFFVLISDMPVPNTTQISADAHTFIGNESASAASPTGGITSTACVRVTPAPAAQMWVYWLVVAVEVDLLLAAEI
jgi:hypothetical protein